MATIKCPHCGGEHPEETETCPTTGGLLTPAMAQVGKIIGGKYELLKLLGEGGMGAVYEARHVEIRQHVAVKLLHFQLARDPEIRQRFFRGAMSAGEIGHENIIQMHDIGRDATGSIYLVMEMLKGESLAEKVRRDGAIPIPQAIDIMLQTLDALASSHRKGITHRDMKPENIFLCRLGGRSDFVKILDFGIAKVKEPADGENLTRTGTMMGTSYYMAPEQIAGDREADHRMDIYACGVILYQMLVGHVPFDATSVHGIIYKIMNEEPAPLTNNRGDVPQGLEEAIRRAMARNRDHRFQSADDFAAAIRPFGTGTIAAGRASMMPVTAPVAGAGTALPVPAATGTGTAAHPDVPYYSPAPGNQPPVAAQYTGPAIQGTAAVSGDQPAPLPAAAMPPAHPAPGAVPAQSAKAAPPVQKERRMSPLLTAVLVILPLLLIGGIAIAAVALIGGFWVTSRSDAPQDPQADMAATPETVGPLYKVLVRTEPTGAAVYIGGDFKGSSPVTLELPEGSTAITAKSPGYASRTTACQVSAGIQNECVVSLTGGDAVDGTSAADAAAGTDAQDAADAAASTDPAADADAIDGEAATPDPDKKKKKIGKCDPRVNPKCKFIDR